MVYPNTYELTSKIIKPTSNIKLAPLTSAALAGAGANVIIDDDKYNLLQKNPQATTVSENEQIINLWQFIRLYTVATIPIVDFIIVYTVIYTINSLYLHYNHKFVLISTVPFTILVSILMNKNMKISSFIIIVMIISIYYLLTLDLEQT
ncbi:putative ORFan [Tupanvirus deep ocean]|uniref:ORFan n=2 Tax=Tupanvirus TaxID=2094720 RepID=A0AC62A8T1_9VIRU|nr:putative ORFan [Tupanvirus deep ocean]QKU34192.1 putative ORFan [Tupanvirus deep ocean]